MFETPKVTAGTWARTIVLALTLINQFLAIFGYSPIPVDGAALELFIATLLTGAASLWNWWKDNDFKKITRIKKARGGR